MNNLRSIFFILFAFLPYNYSLSSIKIYPNPSILFSFNTPPTRLGLHFTKQELEIWRLRAKKGPYKSNNDVSINSPGDWDRTFRNATEFLISPSKDHWKGDQTPGCLKQWTAEPQNEGIKLKDAAFVYLITQEKRYLDAVKTELLAQVSEPLTDFSDTTRWCSHALRDINPSFIIAEWCTRLLFAYDYSKDGFTIEEKDRLNKWFKNAALYFQNNVDKDLGLVFENRKKENYKLTSYSKAVGIERLTSVSHDKGWQIPNLAKFYNNRRASMIRFVGLAGIFLNDPSLKLSAKLFVKEWLKFSVFPDGVMGEFARWDEAFPDMGWSYATYSAALAIDIADHFARNGDMELYTFSTSVGYFGTQGGKKNLLLTLNNLMHYLDSSVVRRVPVKDQALMKYSPVIDGELSEKNWYTVNDTWFAQGNVYFRSKYIKSNYLRTAPHRKPYPPANKLATMGPHQPWSGVWAVYPGMLFMFGQMEGKVWPYPTASYNKGEL